MKIVITVTIYNNYGAWEADLLNYYNYSTV